MKKPTLNEIIFFLAGLLMILVVLPVVATLLFLLSAILEAYLYNY